LDYPRNLAVAFGRHQLTSPESYRNQTLEKDKQTLEQSIPEELGKLEDIRHSSSSSHQNSIQS